MFGEVWAEEAAPEDAMAAHAASTVFPIGAPNDAYAAYFTGKSYLAPVSSSQVGIYNVTFEPGCRNNWHIHHAKTGGGQILVCVAGRGYYQEAGKPAQLLVPGDVVNIPPEVKHWHGAAPDSCSRIWQSRFPARKRPTSGVNRSRTKHIRSSDC